MKTGYVTANRLALLPIRVRWADRGEFDLDAIVDTGFSEYLTLPNSIIEMLQLPRGETAFMGLADGSDRWTPEYRCQILWNGRWRTIPVQSSEGLIVLGMGLLHKHSLSIDVVEDGSVSVEPLE